MIQHFWKKLANVWKRLCQGQGRYHPERYYMRGAGPACRRMSKGAANNDINTQGLS